MREVSLSPELEIRLKQYLSDMDSNCKRNARNSFQGSWNTLPQSLRLFVEQLNRWNKKITTSQSHGDAITEHTGIGFETKFAINRRSIGKTLPMAQQTVPQLSPIAQTTEVSLLSLSVLMVTVFQDLVGYAQKKFAEIEENAQNEGTLSSVARQMN